MKKIKILLLTIFLTTSFLWVDAQCRKFTQDEVVPMLDDFILSGRYNSLKMYEGEELLIYKTLTKGITYRFIVKSQTDLPSNISMKITTWNDDEIYNNQNENYKAVFDYENKKTQRVKIFIIIPKAKTDEKEKSGCVGLVIGLKN